jgi:hypothetical protein
MSNASNGFTTYRTWHEVMEDARAGRDLYYHAPMDYQPTRLRALVPPNGPRAPFTYVVMPRGIRIYPGGSVGRNKTADPFTASSDHVDRFRRKAGATTVDSTLPHPNEAYDQRRERERRAMMLDAQGRSPGRVAFDTFGEREGECSIYVVAKLVDGRFLAQSTEDTLTAADKQAQGASKNRGGEYHVLCRGESIARFVDGVQHPLR